MVSASLWLAVTTLPMENFDTLVTPSKGAWISVRSRLICAAFSDAFASATSAFACSRVTLAFSNSIWVAPLPTNRS
ncbi:hypothetical protein D3C72_2473290 [compost metagenome]